jgi:hypothetical protein
MNRSRQLLENQKLFLKYTIAAYPASNGAARAALEDTRSTHRVNIMPAFIQHGISISSAYYM